MTDFDPAVIVVETDGDTIVIDTPQPVTVVEVDAVGTVEVIQVGDLGGPPGPPGDSSAIISGPTPPTAADGEPGDWYLDTTTAAYYGPKGTGEYEPPENALACRTPPNFVPSANQEIGTRFQIIHAGRITGLRFWRVAASPTTTRLARLWTPAGVLLATSNPSTETAVDGWVDVTLPTPVEVAAGQKVVVTRSMSDATDLVGFGPTNVDPNPDLLIDAGHYGFAAGGFPPIPDLDNEYGTDLVYQKSPDVWPVAIPSLIGPPGGTTIHTGHGPPDIADGNPGDFYLDDVADVLYGPKAGAGTPEHVLPDPTDFNPGTYQLGNTIRFLYPGAVTGARIYRTTGDTLTTRTARLWSGTTLVRTSLATTETAGSAGWYEVTFPTPVPVTVNSEFLVSADVDGTFGYANPPIIEFDDTHATWVTGHYGATGTFPGTSNAQMYPTDVIWVADTGVWPVALRGADPAVVADLEARVAALEG